METNTVLLEVKKYNELYDLEKAIKNGKKLLIEKTVGYGVSEHRYYYTENEIIKELSDKYDKLKKEKEKLVKELEKAEREIPERKMPEPKPKPQFTIEDIKQMNSWQFRAWKAGKLTK